MTTSLLTLASIRTDVRLAIDIDSTDLDDDLVDKYCREISWRIERARKRWPFREESWTLSVSAGTANYALSSIGTVDVDLCHEISSVEPPDRARLQWISQDEAERRFPPTAGQSNPQFFTVWDGELVLYPTPSASESYTLRGYREPIDWVSEGGSGVPDFPLEFDTIIENWVLGRAYMKMEDGELGTFYIDLATNELAETVQNFKSSPPHQPLVIGGGNRSGLKGYKRLVWV